MPRFSGPQQTLSQDSAANAVNTLTLTGAGAPTAPNVSAQPYFVITNFSVYIAGGAAGNDINVVLKSGTRVMWKAVIGSGTARGAAVINQVPIDGWPADPGATVTLTIDAGGASVVTTGNLSYFSA